MAADGIDIYTEPEKDSVVAKFATTANPERLEKHNYK